MLGLSNKNSRIISLLFLGFSSGLPLSLTGSTLQAWYTQSGVNLLTIGALSFIGMPYVWKFFWAPFMDRFVPPLWGRRRGWIGITQLALCLLLFIMSNMNPGATPGILGVLALIIAFVSASQDIAIDAYRTDVLLPEERGMGIANYTFAYRIAMIFSSGLALVFADHFGWRITYEIMAVVMAILIIPTYFAPECSQSVSVPTRLMHTVTESFKNLLQRDAIVLTLVFIVLYKFGDALVVALTSNFLLRELKFSLTDVGLAFKTFGLFATIMGAYAGAVWLKKLGLYRALWIFGVLQASSNFMYMLLAIVGKNYLLMVSTILVESFCSGMSTTALCVFLTSLCSQQYSATQFACLSAFAAIGRVFTGPLAAYLVENIGWASFYFWSSLMCFPAIVILSILRARVSFNAEAVA